MDIKSVTEDIGGYLSENVEKQIPKVFHIVWVGDEAAMPREAIASWARVHPDWEVKVWTNDSYRARRWKLQHHMEDAWQHELCGVADLMRWEILAEEGGVAIDADSFSLRPLPDWLLQCEAFCAAENEIERPGLFAFGFLGTKARNLFFTRVVETLASRADVWTERRHFVKKRRRKAWQATGPLLLTEEVRRQKYLNMTVLPSHFFYPNYKRRNASYAGGGPVYSYQFWGSTKGYSLLSDWEGEQRRTPAGANIRDGI